MLKSPLILGIQHSAVRRKQEVAVNLVIDAEINELWKECLAEIQNNSNENVQNPGKINLLFISKYEIQPILL